VTTPSKAMQMGNLGNDLKEGVVLSIELPPCMTTQKVFSPLSIIVLKDNSHLHLWMGKKDVTTSHTIHWLGEVIDKSSTPFVFFMIHCFQKSPFYSFLWLSSSIASSIKLLHLQQSLIELWKFRSFVFGMVAFKISRILNDRKGSWIMKILRFVCGMCALQGVVKANIN
jgi:hypothetical protein